MTTNWKKTERTFYVLAGAVTVIMIFAALLAIWGVYDISLYWRSLVALGVALFTMAVCAGTASLLGKYNAIEVSAGGSVDAYGRGQQSVWGQLRDGAGAFIIFAFLLHGVFAFFAVWNSHDHLFWKSVLSAIVFLAGFLILAALTNILQYGYKSYTKKGDLNSVVVLVVILAIFAISVFIAGS